MPESIAGNWRVDAWASVCVIYLWTPFYCVDAWIARAIFCCIFLVYFYWIRLCSIMWFGHTVKTICDVDNHKTSIWAMSWFELNFKKIYWRAAILILLLSPNDAIYIEYIDDNDVWFSCNEINCPIFWHKFQDEDRPNWILENRNFKH